MSLPSPESMAVLRCLFLDLRSACEGAAVGTAEGCMREFMGCWYKTEVLGKRMQVKSAG